MANFEGLIRGALAAKDATSPEVRNAVYDSSRNALKRLIESNRGLTVEAAVTEQRALESAIERIENEFANPQPAPQPAPPKREDPLHELKQILLEDSDEFRNAQERQHPVQEEPRIEAPPTAALESSAVQEPVSVEQSAPEETGAEPVMAETRADNPPDAGVGGEAEVYVEPENLPLEFAKRRKSQKIFAWLLASLVVVALLVWLAYYVFVGIMEGTLFGLNDKPLQNPNSPTSETQSAGYITILEPGDLSSLVTANRGEAQIVNELNLEMIRLVSVRSAANRSEPADPILIRLKPGVLEAISGKTVTFEIYGKSGISKPAQFTVKCQFGDLGSCGRKRFRVGLQPEASIFAFEIGEVANSNQSAFIAISTDITEVAAITGKGDPIDIAYARLRAN